MSPSASKRKPYTPMIVRLRTDDKISYFFCSQIEFGGTYVQPTVRSHCDSFNVSSSTACLQS